jgi:uncharacterized Tic20 family protein
MSENPQDLPASSDEPPPQPYSAPPPPPPPPMGGQVPAYGQQAQAPVSPSDARMWSMLTHIGGIFFGFVPSLVVYLIYKDRDPFIRRHAVQALNFQIIATIAYVVSYVLMVVVIGFLTWFATFVAVLVFSIMAAMAANKGEEYTYPMVPQMVT